MAFFQDPPRLENTFEADPLLRETLERLMPHALWGSLRPLWHEMGDFRPSGVNEMLVRRVREALDAAGHERVKIVVSGGFDSHRIREFERKGVPVDAYGVGSSLLRGQNDFTADVVLVDGRECSKVGRRHRPNPRLEVVE